jgi:hypothetical protein
VTPGYPVTLGHLETLDDPVTLGPGGAGFR